MVDIPVFKQQSKKVMILKLSKPYLDNTLTQKMVAKQCAVSLDYVKEVFSNNGIKKQNQTHTWERAATKENHIKVMKYKEAYLADSITQRGISEATGIPFGSVSNVLHINKVKRRTTTILRRLKSFLWFYEMCIYSAKDLARILSASLSTITTYLRDLCVKKKCLVQRVDILIERGFTFDAAIKFTGCSVRSYSTALKRKVEL